MTQKISVEKALKLKNAVFIDVRTKAEFEKDHILGAFNVPIVSNKEREIVGTIYKQVSQKKAIDIGKEFYEKRIPKLIKLVDPHEGKTLIVHCWRGGLRSEIMCTLFESLGFKTYQLEGGYKSYRKAILKELYNFELKPKVYMLHGLTCTGKTALLEKLQNSLNLENLSQHRGSLYGAIGLNPNSQKMFENLLLKRLKELNDQSYILVEGESRRVGNNILPPFLWEAMEKGENVLVKRSLPVRVKEMVKEYFLNPQIVEEIKAITRGLRRVISKKKKMEMLTHLELKEYEKAAEILLVDYYDPLYNHTLDKLDYILEVDNDDLKKAVAQISTFLKTKQ